MKKLLPMIAIIMCVFLASNHLSAADTLTVPAGFTEDFSGAFNVFINENLDDNPNAVFKLQRDSSYYVSAPVIIEAGQVLRLYGEMPTETKRPAKIAPTTNADGGIPSQFFIVNGGLQVENTYFMGKVLGDNKLTAYVADCPVNFTRTEFDNCYFEWIEQSVVYFGGSFSSFFADRCYFRNLMSLSGGEYNGLVFKAPETMDGLCDSISVTNSTIVNVTGNFFNNPFGSSRIVLDHNTIVNNIASPHFLSYQLNAKITNNIYYNTHCKGSVPYERTAHPYGQIESTLSFVTYREVMEIFQPGGGSWPKEDIIETLKSSFPEKIAAYIDPADRVCDFTNNAYFWSHEVQNFWNSVDTISSIIFLNELTQGIFDNHAEWPSMIDTLNVNLDPGFISPPDNMDDLITFITDFRSGNNTVAWGWDPDNNEYENDDMWHIQWPLPENLAYTNETLLTQGEDGYPVGDLYHWFPEKYEHWKSGEPNSTDDDELEVASTFKLAPAYPNPFNPTTTIKFYLPKKENITIEIYNLLGKKVRTLTHHSYQQGYHTVQWNGRDQLGNAVSSGVYFCRMSTKGFNQMTKLTLMK